MGLALFYIYKIVINLERVKNCYQFFSSLNQLIIYTFFKKLKLNLFKTQRILASTRNVKLEDLKSNIQRKSVCIYAEHPNKHTCIKYKLLQANQKHPPPGALETNKN